MCVRVIPDSEGRTVLALVTVSLHQAAVGRTVEAVVAGCADDVVVSAEAPAAPEDRAMINLVWVRLTADFVVTAVVLELRPGSSTETGDSHSYALFREHWCN